MCLGISFMAQGELKGSCPVLERVVSTTSSADTDVKICQYAFKKCFGAKDRDIFYLHCENGGEGCEIRVDLENYQR